MKKFLILLMVILEHGLSVYTQPAWQILSTNTSKNLTKVQCYRQDTLTIFGEDGIVLRSNDGGNSFIPKSHNSAGFATGYFHTPDTGYITSGGGIIFRTQNGGTNWLPGSGGCVCMVTAICFANAQDGIFGAGTGIYKTTDGGQTWSTSPMIFSAQPWKIVSLNDSNFMFTDQKVFYRSTNKANSFTQDTIQYSSSYPLVGLSFLNDTVGFVASSDGRLFKTVNQGLDWDSVGHIGWSVRDLVFVDDKQGYAIVTNQYKTIVKTTDGGLHWYQDYVATDLIETIDYDGDAIYAVGQNGLALKKTVYPTNLPDVQDQSIQMFPNPATDEIFFTGLPDQAEAQLYQSDGKLLRVVEIGQQSPLNISSLSNGIYYLRIQHTHSATGLRFEKN